MLRKWDKDKSEPSHKLVATLIYFCDLSDCLHFLLIRYQDLNLDTREMKLTWEVGRC